MIPTKDVIDVKIHKTRTPKNAESITKGAMNLPLQERVLLRDALSESIDAEVETNKQAYEDSLKIANGNKY